MPDLRFRVATLLAISARPYKMTFATAVEKAVLAGFRGQSTVSVQSRGLATLTGLAGVCHPLTRMGDSVGLCLTGPAMAAAAVDRAIGRGRNRAHFRILGQMILTGIAGANLLKRHPKRTTVQGFHLPSMAGHTSRRPGSSTKRNSSLRTYLEDHWSTMWI